MEAKYPWTYLTCEGPSQDLTTLDLDLDPTKTVYGADREQSNRNPQYDTKTQV